MKEYISREEARRFFQVSENCQDCKRDPYKCEHYDEWNLMDICSTLDDIPTADVVEVRHGRWIVDRAFGNDVLSGEQMVICSVCQKGIFWGKQNYCPNCGAKMDGGADDAAD